MSSKKPVHVVPHKGEWAVKREGSERASSTHKTQAEAESTGRASAKKDHTEFLLHNREGEIRKRDSYGNDPNPPRDKN